MPIPTQDMLIYGIGVTFNSLDVTRFISLRDFFFHPEPGERSTWSDTIRFPPEPYDDGGGAALAAYRYGRCPFV